MNKKDLDALKELYSSVYDEEQLNEDPPNSWLYNTQMGAIDFIRNLPNAKSIKIDGGNGKPTANPTAKPSTNPPSRFARERNAKPGLADIRGRDSSLASPIAGTGPQGNQVGSRLTPASTPTAARPAAGSGSTPPQRPAARPSGPVLSKKDGVEGTGVGADFKARAFSAAEKSRYSSVAA